MAYDPNNRALTFEQACAKFRQRFTMEHVPGWALEPRADGTHYAPQYSSDREWYDRTFFYGEHYLAGKRHCHSTFPSWPLGVRLAEPFHVEQGN